MRNYFKQSIAFICAFYFLIAGSGYNIVRYCCDGCAQEGIEAVASKSCEVIHHEHEHNGNACCNHNTSGSDNHMACSDMNHQTDGCHLLRLQTDTPSIDIVSGFNHTDFGIILDLPYAVLSLLFENSTFDNQYSLNPPDNIPLFSGRDVLTRHVVLLI